MRPKCKYLEVLGHALPTEQLLFEDVVVEALGDLSLQTRAVALEISGVRGSLCGLDHMCVSLPRIPS